MSEINQIRTDAELDLALARIEEIFDAEPGTPEDRELGALFDLVEQYEDKHHRIGPPEPHEMVKWTMIDRFGMTPEDLVPCIGSLEAVHEVLDGKRPITAEMALALNRKLDIPLDLLLQETAALSPPS